MSLLLIAILVGCLPLPTIAQYDSQGRRIIKADRNGNISASDQAFMANMKAQTEARQPCPTAGSPQQPVDRSQLEVARNAIAQGNSARAYQMLFPLSRVGDADAEYMVGKILATTANPDLRNVAGNAAICLRLAAAQGHVQAQTAYAVLIKREFGQPVYSAVFGMFQNAANHGDVEAEYNLGLMYSEGQGVAKNEALAKDWLRKAASGGSSDAQQHLTQLQADAAPISLADKQDLRDNFVPECVDMSSREDALLRFTENSRTQVCRCEGDYLFTHITRQDADAVNNHSTTSHFKQITREGVQQCKSHYVAR
jgi:TPR repeat protein